MCEALKQILKLARAWREQKKLDDEHDRLMQERKDLEVDQDVQEKIKEVDKELDKAGRTPDAYRDAFDKLRDEQLRQG